MPAAISTLRGTLAAALVNNSLWSTFSFPPATPIANSVVVSPADPYVTPSNNGYNTIAPLANFLVNIFVPLLDNEGNLNGIEDRLVSVFNLLAASSIVYNVGTVSAPSVLTSATGDLLTCSMQVSILSNWS
jgi:hypothetical protein